MPLSDSLSQVCIYDLNILGIDTAVFHLLGGRYFMPFAIYFIKINSTQMTFYTSVRVMWY